MIEFCESLAETMFKFTNIVMKYAPIGVAAAMAYTIGKGGFGVLYNLAWLVGTLLHRAGRVLPARPRSRSWCCSASRSGSSSRR